MAAEIVVGYDGSDSAKAALTEATAMAAALGATLLVTFGYEPAAPVGGELADLRHKVEEYGEEICAQALAAVTEIDPNVRAEAVLVDARPADALVALADQREARMIVVGHGGRAPLLGALLGSVTYKVLHAASCPVLVVQPTEQDT